MGAKTAAKASALMMGFGLLWASAALPTEAGGSAAEAFKGKAKDDPSRRICRNITPSGSRLTTRICRTKAEWDGSQTKAADGVFKHQVTEATGYQRAAGP